MQKHRPGNSNPLACGIPPYCWYISHFCRTKQCLQWRIQGGPGPPCPQDFFPNHAVFRQLFRKNPILSKFWAHLPPGVKLRWPPWPKSWIPAWFVTSEYPLGHLSGNSHWSTRVGGWSHHRQNPRNTAAPPTGWSIHHRTKAPHCKYANVDGQPNNTRPGDVNTFSLFSCQSVGKVCEN